MRSQWNLSHSCYEPRRALEAAEPYGFQYTHPCEPYVIGLKAALPPFDGRWRGRYIDKASYIAHLAAWGTQFMVASDLFMIHLPHAAAHPLYERPADPHDPVFADLWALPFALMRVFLADVRLQPEFRVEVLPYVAPLDPHQVREAMEADRAELAHVHDLTDGKGLPSESDAALARAGRAAAAPTPAGARLGGLLDLPEDGGAFGIEISTLRLFSGAAFCGLAAWLWIAYVLRRRSRASPRTLRR